MIFYSRPDCHLCDVAKEALLPLLEGTGLRLEERNVEERDDWEGAYGTQIPVAFLQGLKLFKYRVDPERVGRRLLAATEALRDGAGRRAGGGSLC